LEDRHGCKQISEGFGAGADQIPGLAAGTNRRSDSAAAVGAGRSLGAPAWTPSHGYRTWARLQHLKKRAQATASASQPRSSGPAFLELRGSIKPNKAREKERGRAVLGRGLGSGRDRHEHRPRHQGRVWLEPHCSGERAGQPGKKFGADLKLVRTAIPKLTTTFPLPELATMLALCTSASGLQSPKA
jgi:hypothetical protein